jgi:hypothetical protein
MREGLLSPAVGFGSRSGREGTEGPVEIIKKKLPKASFRDFHRPLGFLSSRTAARQTDPSAGCVGFPFEFR